MEKELNIAAILKDKPKGIKLWSDTFGVVTFEGLSTENECYPIRIACDRGNCTELASNGHYFINSEDALPCIVPSKSMRDWSKFAWKKGDVLHYGKSTVVFERWIGERYISFIGAHEVYGDNSYSSGSSFITKNYMKTTEENEIKNYLANITKLTGGKLNLETLEIEKPQFKDGDIVQIGDDAFVILKEIEPYKASYHYYYKDGITNFNDSVNIAGQSLKLASKADQLTILSHLKEYFKRQWDAEKKAIVDLPKKCEFKAFDKVLVRDTKDEYWRPAFFASLDEDSINEYGYCLIGDPDGVFCKYCIPYNDQTAHLLGTTNDWKGGEG